MRIVTTAPRVRAVVRTVAEYRPSWLLFTPDLDDETVDALLSAARTVSTDLLTAVLGHCDDVDRCERWARRGARVYLGARSGIGRIVDCLRVADREDVLIIDRCFHDAAQRDRVQPVGKPTRRELDVLRLARRGLSNADLARELHVAESTVEFHLRNLLTKFGAKNRVEMIERATRLGM